MPNIVIKEFDKTNAGYVNANNFTVVVPGFISEDGTWDPAEDDYIREYTSTADFIKDVGFVAPETGKQCGNQIAYNLLELGYTVIYMAIESYADLKDSSKWEPLKDRSVYNFRYLLSGMLDDITIEDSDSTTIVTVKEVNNCLNNVAEWVNSTTLKEDNGRGDCIALQDIAKNVYATCTSQSSAITAIENYLDDTFKTDTYCGIFAPTVYFDALKDERFENKTEFPGSFHYLACAANSALNYAEWYANSGYNRGIARYPVTGTSFAFGDVAVNKLQKRDSTKPAVNLIIKLNNSYYLYGNRTGKKNKEGEGLTAQNFLNIRQLCCTLKKVTYNTCRRLMFDPNSDLLWLNFCNAIRPTLERMKADQGIADYDFVKLNTTVKAKLNAAIRIVPIEAVEDFEIGIYLEDNLDNALIDLSENELLG